MADNQLTTQGQQRQHELFVVTARGHHRQLPVPSPREAHETAAELRRRTLGRDISWMLLAGSPVPAEFCGRYRPMRGLAESRRVAHLFLLPPGAPVGTDRLTAFCGEPIRADQLEILPGRAGGMPCYRCLARIPAPDDTNCEGATVR